MESARPTDTFASRLPWNFGKARLGVSDHSTFRLTTLLHCHSFEATSMARGVEGNEMSTPRPSQKKQPPSGSQSAKTQKSILGFFQKKATNSPSPAPSQLTPAEPTPTSTLSKKSFSRPRPSLTPVPSSDAPGPSSPIRQEEDTPVATGRNKENGLLPRVSILGTEADRIMSEVAGVALSSPSRKVCMYPCIFTRQS